MCLGIPGQVVDFLPDSDQLARVDVTGVTRNINVGLVRDEGVEIGDWVLIHVGFALSVIDEEEAARTLDALKTMGEQFDAEVEEIARSRIE